MKNFIKNLDGSRSVTEGGTGDWFFKVINGLVPTYLSSILPDMREQRYDLGKTNSIVAPKFRADALKKQFFPHGINEWNNLSLEFREVRPLSLFKTRLISLVRSVKGQLYGIHDLHGVRRLTQLRVGLSPLHDHTFGHNFLDIKDPMCLSYDGIENAVHTCCPARNTLSTEPCSLAKLPPFAHLMELIVTHWAMKNCSFF